MRSIQKLKLDGLPTDSGVYLITSPSGKRYVGSARNIRKRKNHHLAALKKGTHHNRYLQRAWTKYGSLEFSVLLICAPQNQFFYEQLVLDGMRPEYNISPTALGTSGLKWTETSKAKIKGRKVDGTLISAGMMRCTTPEQRSRTSALARASWTEESRKSQIASLTGRRDSVETRERKSVALKGKVVPPDVRAKLAAQKGWKHSDEAKAKMRGRTRSVAHATKLAASRIGSIGYWHGKTRDPETNKKISAKLLGRVISEEVRQRMRDGQAARRAKLNSVGSEVKI